MSEVKRSTVDRLEAELAELRARLHEPEEIVRAIREGEVDAFVVNDPNGEQVYRLRNVDVLYRGMIEQMHQGAVTLDESGLILYTNRCFADLVRTERLGVVGTSFLTFVPEESHAYFDDPDATEVQRELLLRARDGTPLPVHVSSTRIVLEGNPVRCLIVTDLTETQRSEQLLAESRRKDEFLAMLAHELRNPIAPIQNAVQVLEMEPPAAATVKWATQIIGRQVTQLSRLVNDLMDIARITRGKVQLDLHPTDLVKIVTRAVEASQSVLGLRRHRVTVDVPDQRIAVCGDAARLSQVVSNILNNAAKFTPEGGLISLRLEQVGDIAVITVTDNGIGIAADMIPRVFDLFAQGDTTLERGEGGLGIGLALVRSVVEMHGGQVLARSDGPGRGSSFVVRLPIHNESAEEDTVDRPRTRPVAHAQRVMVVDDNLDAAESLAVLLETLGHEVRTVTEGAKVIDIASEFEPHVMFLDISLPDVNGYDIAVELRRLPNLAGLTLVALTGYGLEEYRRRSREAGFDHHWVKPLDIEELEALFEQPMDG